MSPIDAFFPHILCLNLDRRPERWTAMQQSFHQHGIQGVARLAAVDARHIVVPDRWQSTPGAYARLRSHLAAVRHAKSRGWPSVLIVEDDVAFADDLAARIEAAFLELPDRWAMLALGGLHREEPCECQANLRMLRRTEIGYAVALNGWFYDHFLEAHSSENDPIVTTNLMLQRDHACYGIMPHVAWPCDGWSDLYEEPMSYNAEQESLVVGGDRMKLLLQHTSLIMAYGDDVGPINLNHVMGWYGEQFPEVEMVVVGSQPAPWSQEPVAPARYYQLAEDAQRDDMLRFGYSFAKKPNQIFIFADANVMPRRELVVRTAVTLCETYDGTVGFGSLLRLDKEDSQRFRHGKQAAIDFSRYPSEEQPAAHEGFCVLTRDGLDRIGGWFPEDFGQLRLYPATNRALRLA